MKKKANKESFNKRNLYISSVICIVLLPVFTFVWILYGPFEALRRTWICTALSTANHKYLATAFFSDETIDWYTSEYFDTIKDIPEQDKSAITPSAKGKITVTDVQIGLSRGKLLCIPNPAKIDVAVCDYIGNSGLTLDNLIRQEMAIGGINAGAYVSEDGTAHGSVPGGVIIKDGEIVYMQKDYEKEFCIIGFDSQNILTVEYADSAEKINSLNLRCAVSFGPPLIINGKGLIEKTGASLQPRSAIAQRADGAVLFLVLDGRQASSAGATLKNVQDVLLQHGAVTAANLDGGSSSAMIYNKQLLNNPSDDGELKKIPTAFIIKEK